MRNPANRPVFKEPPGNTFPIDNLINPSEPPVCNLLVETRPSLFGQFERWEQTPLDVPPFANAIPLVPTITIQLLALMRGAKAGPPPLCKTAVIRADKCFNGTLAVLTMNYPWLTLSVPVTHAACMPALLTPPLARPT